MADSLLARKGDAKGRSAWLRATGGGKRFDKLVELPPALGDGSMKARVWVLREQETVDARSAAMKFLLDTCKLDPLAFTLDPSLFDSELERQLIARAFRDPADANSPLFEDANEVRLFIDADTREALMGVYLAVLEERSPLIKVRTEEEVKELVSLLGKEPMLSAFVDCSNTDSVKSTLRALGAALKTLMSKSS